MTGAKILLECLKEEGVDTLFGYPGGAVIPLYDALYDYKDFNHIRTAHEQGAVHGADGYARSTGKVGVCFVTSGPGATNAVTGIATAYMDSVPLVIITGQVSTELLGKDSFQEVDITGITFSVTKHNYLVRKVEDLSKIVHEAFNIAKSGRPGPVLIDIPKDIFLAEYDYEKSKTNNAIKEMMPLDKSLLGEIVELINNSKKPLIYSGGGVEISKAGEELIALAEKGDIPVVNTLMALGNIPRTHELSLGLVGMHGFKENNLAVTNSDLLIAIGARFSDRVVSNAKSFASGAKIIHLDIDCSEIDKNVGAYISMVGDLKSILKSIGEKIEKKDNSLWKEEINSFKANSNDNYEEFTPRNILKSFNKVLGKSSLVATDVGQHQMWVAQYWDFTIPKSFITSGGLGTMGFGMGAAIGAKVGNPEKDVLLVTGDGSFRMNCNELFTVHRYNIPIIILMMNNSTLGMVRQWQRMFCGARYSETDVEDFDYVKLVEGYGIEAYKASSMDELKDILGKVRLGIKPLFIECKINKEESVYPIVPPGKPIYNIVI